MEHESVEIQKQKEDSDNMVSKIKEYSDQSESLVAQMQEKQKRSESLFSNTQKSCDQSQALVSEIQKQKEDSDNIASQIQENHNSSLEIINKQKKNMEDLVKRIENLLPGATSAGLASSYYDAWREKNTILHWMGFIFSLLFLTSVYFYYLILQSQEISLATILTRLIAGVPLIWIAWYCQKSISQTNRIKEEYRHKEKSLRVFDGFSNKINELTKEDPSKNKEKKLEFISDTMNAIKKNPSEILDPSETFLNIPRRKNENQRKNNSEE